MHKRFLATLLAMALLMSVTACTTGKIPAQTDSAAHESVEADAAFLSTPALTVTETSELTATPTPSALVDAVTISPEPTATPIEIYIPTAEEQELINREATALFKRAAKNFSDTTKFTFNDDVNIEYTINGVNGLRGNFDGFKELDDFNSLSDEEKSILKGNITSKVVGICDELAFEFMEKGNYVMEEGETETFINPETYRVFELLETDSTYFTGTETLKLIEEKYITICNLLNDDWDTFEAEARAFQTLIEDVFFGNSTEWDQVKITHFEDMSPGIKKFCDGYVICGLTVIIQKAAKEGKSIKTSCYTSQLKTKIRNERREYSDGIYQDFSELIDAYLARK